MPCLEIQNAEPVLKSSDGGGKLRKRLASLEVKRVSKPPRGFSSAVGAQKSLTSSRARKAEMPLLSRPQPLPLANKVERQPTLLTLSPPNERSQ